MQQRLLNPEDKEIDNEILLVGDKHIRQYLLDKRSSIVKPEPTVEEMLAYYKQKISELEDLSDE